MSINLQKITLEKKGDSHTVNLVKGDQKNQEIVINLNWTKQGETKKVFFFFNQSTDIDLDLGCFYELNNGQRSVIDGVQFAHGQGGNRHTLSRQGCYDKMPWIWHTGDDRSGSSSDGENILINSNGIQEIKRIIVYCFIYQGVARWSETNAVATLKVPHHPEIVVEMGQQNANQSFCALAELTFQGNDRITMKKLLTFHDSHENCDRTYNWGLQWQAGGK